MCIRDRCRLIHYIETKGHVPFVVVPLNDEHLLEFVIEEIIISRSRNASYVERKVVGRLGAPTPLVFSSNRQYLYLSIFHIATKYYDFLHEMFFCWVDFESRLPTTKYEVSSHFSLTNLAKWRPIRNLKIWFYFSIFHCSMPKRKSEIVREYFFYNVESDKSTCLVHKREKLRNHGITSNKNHQCGTELKVLNVHLRSDWLPILYYLLQTIPIK